MALNIKLADFSLRKVKSFQGMDGEGFNADVMLKNVMVAFAADSGDGGEMRIDWVGGKRFTPPPMIEEFLAGEEAKAKSDEREKDFRSIYDLQSTEPLPTKWCPADFIEYLLEKHHHEGEVKKFAKKFGFVFAKKGSGEFPIELFGFRKPKDFKWTQKALDEEMDLAKKDLGEIVILVTPKI